MDTFHYSISSIGMEYATDIMEKLDSFPKNIDLMKNAKSGQTPKLYMRKINLNYFVINL